MGGALNLESMIMTPWQQRPDFILFNLSAAITALTPVYNLADTEASPLTRDQEVRLGLAYQALARLKRELGNDLPAQD